jgi:hypothetical protein
LKFSLSVKFFVLRLLLSQLLLKILHDLLVSFSQVPLKLDTIRPVSVFLLLQLLLGVFLDLQNFLLSFCASFIHFSELLLKFLSLRREAHLKITALTIKFAAHLLIQKSFLVRQAYLVLHL